MKKFDYEVSEIDMKVAEHNFPGITQYGCLDPYFDYDPDGKFSHSKCGTCPRKSKCAGELGHIYKVIDDFGKPKERKKVSHKKSVKRMTKKSKRK